ncbi:hypothetical protein M0813_19911 [Anaeramoeba flamelloides]|uniref:Uncharacterized protein n=1 Tax=Anaeramoeba flamelloides TaxID=1746091 RepID=A0ABQ8YLL5_9EUKA|nr:hypothetical protein M0813_19911 [Anaeramoeba flamelloides]
MFLKPKGYLISEIGYNPKKETNQIKGGEQTKTQKVVQWSQAILQQPNLSVGHLLKRSSLILLNLVNVLVPCKMNEVIYTSSHQEQRNKNFNEYLETLKRIKYPKVEEINPQAFFKSDRSSKKKVICSLSFIKRKSEEQGILKETSREKRQFYLFKEKGEELNFNRQIYQYLQIRDKSQEEKEKEKYKEKEKEIMNPYLIKENFDPLEKSFESKNVFWEDQEKRIRILKKIKQKRQEEYSSTNSTSNSNGYSNVNENEISSQEYKPLQESEDSNFFSSEGNDECKWGEIDFDQVEELQRRSNEFHKKSSTKKTPRQGENESDHDSGKGKKGEKTLSATEPLTSGGGGLIGSREQINGNENTKGDNGKRDMEFLNFKPFKSTHTPSNGSQDRKRYNSTKDKKMIQKMENRKKTESEKSKIHEKNKKKAKKNKKKAKKKNEKNERNERKRKRKRKKKKDEEIEKKTKSIIESLSENEGDYELVDYLNLKNRYLKRNLNQIIKLKSKSKNQNNSYIFTIFFLINTLDNWENNSYSQTLKFRDPKLIKKYDKMGQIAFENSENYLKKGFIKFLFQSKYKNINNFQCLSNFFFESESGSGSVSKSISESENEFEEKDFNRNNKKRQQFKINDSINGKEIEGESENEKMKKYWIQITKKYLIISDKKSFLELCKIKLSDNLKINIEINKKINTHLKLNFENEEKQLILDFQSEEERFICLTTLILFLKSSKSNLKEKKDNLLHNNKKKGKQNKKNENDHVYNDKNNNKNKKGNIQASPSAIDYPELVPPNKKFLKLYSTLDDVVDKNNVKRLFEKYYNNKGVNFLVAIESENVRKKKDKEIKKISNLKPGFLKIRRNCLIIGVGKKALETVSFKKDLIVRRAPKKNQCIEIQWTQSHACRATSEPSITLVCNRTSERSLIIRSIFYFIKQWKREKKSTLKKKKKK